MISTNLNLDFSNKHEMAINLFYAAFIIMGSLCGGAIGFFLSNGSRRIAALGFLTGFGVGISLGLVSHAIVVLISNDKKPKLTLTEDKENSFNKS